MATMTQAQIEAEIRDLRRIVNVQREEAEVFERPLADDDHADQRQRIADMNDEMLVFAVLCAVKAAEEGCSRAGRQIATMCVGELMSRFVPEYVTGVAMAMYEGGADGEEA